MPLPPSGFVLSLNQMERRSRPISAESPAETIGDGGDDVGDGNRDDHMHQNSRKWYISNGGSSRVSVFSQGSLCRSINKDAAIACEKFGYKGTIFCGVFDGHGNHGHIASRMARDRLPELVLDEICRWGNYKISRPDAHKQKYMGVYSSGYSGKNDRDHHHHATTIHDHFAHGHGLGRDVLGMWRQSLCNAFERMDTELAVPSDFGSHLSATTSLILVKHGNHLILGNVGNSRAVLGTRAHDGSVIALQLTMGIGSEHKYRVKASSLPPPSVHRLCLPEKAIPGLARARAFDENRLDAYNGMLTSSLKPEVTTQRLSEKDEFIVLATEGVWDILTNQEVVDTVASISDRSLAAEAVVSRAMGAWMARRADYLTDDCAAVCLFI